MEVRVSRTRRLRGAARRRDADDVDEADAQPRDDLSGRDPSYNVGVVEYTIKTLAVIPTLRGRLRREAAGVRNRVAAALVGPLLHGGLELLEEDGVVAELVARLPAGPEAAAVELARHVPRARVGR